MNYSDLSSLDFANNPFVHCDSLTSIYSILDRFDISRDVTPCVKLPMELNPSCDDITVPCFKDITISRRFRLRCYGYGNFYGFDEDTKEFTFNDFDFDNELGCELL